MNLLPKNKSEFSQAQYWNTFFKQRGNKAFEWYGEYPELCVFLHKYIKHKDNVLVVGCGNSRLSADLYDVGYRNIISIDISKVAIKQMKAINLSRPGLQFQEMDAMNMSFSDDSFSVVVDKGTLDALMPDGEEETMKKILQYFQEIERVLRVGGRYMCVSLLQEHILSKLLDHFTDKGWMIRICRCNEAEEKSSRNGASVTLPVFVIICTKFKKLPNSKPLLEMGLTSDGQLNKVESVDSLSSLVRELQEVAMVCGGLQRSHVPGKEVVLDVLSPDTEQLKYKVTVVEKKSVTKAVKFAAFIVPQGRESEYLYGTCEGRQELVESLSMDRLAVIFLGNEFKLTSMAQVKDDLTSLVSDVAPAACKGRIPFLSTTSYDDENAKEVTQGKSEFSGEFVVTDVESNGETLRKLYFKSNLNVVQSEARLKKVKTRRGKKLVVDVGYLSCKHHYFMSLGACSVLDAETEGSILLIGLGGGSLCGYLHRCFAKSDVTAVDLDPAMIRISTEFFNLAVDKRMHLHVADGIHFVRQSLEKGDRYDVVMFDVDNKDLSLGMACPPKQFVENSLISSVHTLLTDRGVFILNLVCRNSNLRTEVYKTVGSVFGPVSWMKVPDELGEVLFSWKKTPTEPMETLTNASIALNKIIENHKFNKAVFLDDIKSEVKKFP